MHYTSSDVARMQEWTNDEVRDVFAQLADSWARLQRRELSKAAFNKMEIVSGWNHALGHSLLSSDMAARANLPEGTYYDWMHTLVSSGGVAQYHIAQLVHRILKLSRDKPATLKLLDDIRLRMMWPASSPKLRKLVLGDRLPKKKKLTGHVRMFAAETIQIMIFLGLYCQMVLVPQGQLGPEVECFTLMGRILYILRSGSAAVAKVDLLWQLILEHHDRFMALYPGCAKIKLHLLLHIAGQLKRWGVNLSCFAAERKHKASKQIAAFAFNKWCQTMLHRNLAETMELWAKPETFLPYFMPRAKAIDWTQCFATEDAAAQLFQLGAQERSSALRTPLGTMTSKDLVVYTTSADFQVGFVKAFFKLQDGRIFASLTVLNRVSATEYSRDPTLTRRGLVACQCLRGAFPYLPVDDNTIFLVASADCLL